MLLKSLNNVFMIITYSMQHEILMLVKDAMPSSLAHGYQHFGGT